MTVKCFVSPLIPVGRLSRWQGCSIGTSSPIGAASTRRRSAQRSRVSWVCKSEAHPYGNGGLNNVADFENYDRTTALQERAELEAAFAKYNEEQATIQNSMWSLILNTDMIQWDNNLLSAAAEVGIDLNLTEARVVTVPESTASAMFDGHIDNMFVLRDAARSDANASAKLITATAEGFQGMLITFQTEDDASRFAMNMDAEGLAVLTPEKMPLSEIKAACLELNLKIGFVTPSFVQPTHFKEGFGK